MDDLEVRQALSVIRDRLDTQKAVDAAAAAAAESEAEADAELAVALDAAGDDWRSKFLQSWNEADDDDMQERGSIADSTTSTTRRRAARAAAGEGDGAPEWDSSTVTGESKRAAASASAMEAAAELMETNPKLKSKHSVKSLAAAVESAMTKPPEVYQPPLPPLRLVTIHENPRVTADKSADPSNLPYLHRNPAV
jgi:hypothetical protein